MKRREKEESGERVMDLLFKLITATGPSGEEDEVRKIILKEIKPYVDQIKIDKFGNVIAHKKGKGQKILLAAHMDEVGLIIENIEQEGWIRCSEVGWIEPLVLLGERVTIETKKGPIIGILTTREISNDDAIKELPKLDDIVVDTGLTKRELTKLGVERGTYLKLILKPTFLGNKQIIAGKALDNRLGCYALIELAKRLKKTFVDVQYAFTVQEEIGLIGSKTSVYNINPDWAIIIDVTSTDDFDGKNTKMLGKGPCITIKDAEIITNRKLNEHIKTIAKAERIPFQLEVTEKGTTDAASISTAKGGIPSTIISIPIRNIHTTSSIAHGRDIELAIKLIETTLKAKKRVNFF